MPSKQIPPLTGPVLFGLTAFCQPFSRGLTNAFFGLLCLWGLIWLFYGRKRWSIQAPPFPGRLLKGFFALSAAFVLSSIFSAEPILSFKTTAKVLYLTAAAPLTWLVLSIRPKLLTLLPFIYGGGLIVSGAAAFYEADLCLKCVRAKGSLGIMELSGILSQLPPLLVGAMALGLRTKSGVAKTIFFLAAMLAAGAAIIINCSRIAMICAPLLTSIMFAANFRFFKNVIGAALVAIAVSGALFMLTDERISARFADMTSSIEESKNNQYRFIFVSHGLKTFKQHPVLGVGPGAKPSPIYPAGSGRYAHSHNLFINFLAELGVVGLFAFLFFLFCPISLLWRRRRSKDPLVFFWTWAALLVFLQLILNGLTDYLFSNSIVMTTFHFILGAALWASQARPEKEEDLLV